MRSYNTNINSNTHKVYVGIDPGVFGSGGAAIIYPSRVDFVPAPQNPAHWVYTLAKVSLPPNHYVTIERVVPFPRDTPKTAWALSGSFYSILTSCEALHLDYKLVAPKVWQGIHRIAFQPDDDHKGGPLGISQDVGRRGVWGRQDL